MTLSVPSVCPAFSLLGQQTYFVLIVDAERVVKLKPLLWFPGEEVVKIM